MYRLYPNMHEGIGYNTLFIILNIELKAFKPNRIIIGKVYFTPLMKALILEELTKDQIRLIVTRLPNRKYKIDVRTLKDFFDTF